MDLYGAHNDWIFYCRKIVSSLRSALILDELTWDLDGDYPRIVLEVIQDLVRGRIFFKDSRNKDKIKPFLHSNFLKVYFHNKGIELVQLHKIFKTVNSCIPRSFSSTDNPTIIYKKLFINALQLSLIGFLTIIKESCTCNT